MSFAAATALRRSAPAAAVRGATASTAAMRRAAAPAKMEGGAAARPRWATGPRSAAIRGAAMCMLRRGLSAAPRRAALPCASSGARLRRAPREPASYGAPPRYAAPPHAPRLMPWLVCERRRERPLRRLPRRQ